MVGSGLIQTFLDGEASKATLIVGVAFEMISGVAIVTIGLLLYRILKVVNKKVALGYPIFRIIEFAFSATCGIYLIYKLEVVPNYQLIIYIPTAIGGLILTYLLYISKLVPRPIAIIGLLGYFLLLIGSLVDFPTSLDINKMPGILTLIPGGLFEFVFFPIWLIVKGFNLTTTERTESV